MLRDGGHCFLVDGVCLVGSEWGYRWRVDRGFGWWLRGECGGPFYEGLVWDSMTGFDGVLNVAALVPKGDTGVLRDVCDGVPGGTSKCDIPRIYFVTKSRLLSECAFCLHCIH